MISTGDLVVLTALVLASIPNFYYLTPILNTAAWTIVANVLTVTSGSSICAVNKSCGDNELFTAELRFTSGTVDVRIANRFLTNTSPNATYYWAGVTGANFRIGKTVDGVFTTLASVAYTLTVNTWATITLQVVGGSIVATIDDGATQAQLSVNDSDIDFAGTHFVRTGPTNNCALECRALSVEMAS